MPFPELVHDAPSACSPAGGWSLYWAKRDAEVLLAGIRMRVRTRRDD